MIYIVVDIMMLNADMALIFDISNMTSEGEVIGCVYETYQAPPGETRDWSIVYANDMNTFWNNSVMPSLK